MSLSMTSHCGVRTIKGGIINRKPELDLHLHYFLLRFSVIVKGQHKTFKKENKKKKKYVKH